MGAGGDSGQPALVGGLGIYRLIKLPFAILLQHADPAWESPDFDQLRPGGQRGRGFCLSFSGEPRSW